MKFLYIHIHIYIWYLYIYIPTYHLWKTGGQTRVKVRKKIELPSAQEELGGAKSGLFQERERERARIEESFEGEG